MGTKRPINDPNARYYVYHGLVNNYMSLFAHSSHHPLSIEDIYQAGMLALLESARSYRVTLNVNFRIYAGTKIKKSMLKEFQFQKEWYENKYDNFDVMRDTPRIDNHEQLTDIIPNTNDQIRYECCAFDHKCTGLLINLISHLSTKQKHIIYLRYYQGFSFMQIGRLFGISESGAWHNHDQILKLLRQNYFAINPTKEYLPKI